MQFKSFKIAQMVIFALVLSLTLQAIGQTSGSAQYLSLPQAGQADSALQEGRRLLRRGQADQALGYLETALALYTAAKNGRGTAAAENEVGDLYLRQGQFKVALDHYQKSYQAFAGVATTEEKNDATASNAAGRVAGGNAGTLTGAAASAANANGFNANLLLAKIGDTNYRLGRLAEASAAYGRMQVKKPEGAASRTARRFGGLGGVIGGITSGRVDVEAPTTGVVSILEAKKELDLYRDSIVYSNHELGMGRVAYANNDLQTAQKHFQNAFEATGASLANVAKLGQTKRFRAAARTSLADVMLRQGKPKDAAKLYEDAAKGAKDDKRLDLMWPAQRGLGRSLWLQAADEKDQKKASKIREKAIESYRDAIATIETLREGSIRADEARTTFLATTKDVYDEAAAALAEMALQASNGSAQLDGKALEYGAEGFKISEQARARSLLDLLAETDSQITAGVPADLLARKQENLDKQQELAQQLSGLSLAADQKKKPSEIEAELEKLQNDFDEIENQIRTSSPKYASLTGGQILTLTDVQQKVLDDRTVLLEYSLRSDASYLWVITKSSTALYKLPPRPSVDKLAMDFRSQLIPSRLQRRIVGIDVIAEPQRGVGAASATEEAAPTIAASNALYKVVLEPAASAISDKRLLVVADGALNYIPFQALVTSANATDFASAPYLIKTNEVISAPSASVIAAVRQSASKPAGNSMLIIADPVFNSNDTRARSVVSKNNETRGLGLSSAVSDVTGQDPTPPPAMQGLPLARLLGTRTEADQIAKLAQRNGGQADVWLDLNASEGNVEAKDIAKYRVIHVATHGLLDAERPQFTGIVLSLIGNEKEDGFVRTDEVFNLRLGSPLVMLSACETGLGKEKRGEGVMGLTRAFMYAGAPTVGVSLWSVADRSTADLMTEFYKRYLASEATPSASAMREAQLAMIGGKKYAAPFFWAPFILVGDWH